ncbi:hypothetical protein [Fulvimarina manganoxydans]|uniref:hypothetical protein n=1 Tax=Fulvimarina manganoxydans TaxID=937218 RepID=UPI00111C00DD|nr:hypothetical protein [Fulvimarina manganoxydans]
MEKRLAEEIEAEIEPTLERRLDLTASEAARAVTRRIPSNDELSTSDVERKIIEAARARGVPVKVA